MNIPDTNLLYKEIDGEKRLAISYSQLTTFMDCPYKWYRTYLLGERDKSKHEATSYGTCVHQTLEHFFNTGRALTRQQMCDTFCYYAEKEQIPYISLHSQIKGHIDSMKIINWIADIYERDKEGNFVKKDVSRAEYIMRMSNVAGVEEDFVLKYRLPYPININGKEESHVYFIGSLDLHLEKNGFHTIIDWKSDGKGRYDEKKLESNLQHPIYSMYLLRKYGVYPRSCLYIHTRSQICEEVKVDKERINKSVESINSTLRQMYSFANQWAEACKRKDDDFDEYELVKKTNPTPLCFWCNFSRTSGNGVCQYSSNYTKTSDTVTIKDILDGQEEVIAKRKEDKIKKKRENDEPLTGEEVEFMKKRKNV